MNKGEDRPNSAAPKAAGGASQRDARLAYRFMYDLVAKMVFSQNPDLLQNLVARLLKIGPASIRDFRVANTEIVPESLGEKFCRLDIVMIVDGRLVNLEVQIVDEKDFVDRSIYYLAREFSSALPASGKYTDLPQTIVISIIDFVQFGGSPGFYSEFRFLETKRRELLTDKLCMIYCELPKLPDICGEMDANIDGVLELWLSLFKARTEQDLADIEGLGVDVLSRAVAAYRSVTASNEFKDLERIRAKARHNEAQAIYNAEQRLNEHWQGIVDEKDTALAEMLAEKDTVISEKDTVISEKDTALAEKDALIAKLQAMVAGNMG